MYYNGIVIIYIIFVLSNNEKYKPIVNIYNMKLTENKLRICYYCRVSTSHQEFLLQKECLDRVLNNRNDVILVKVFSEKLSGYSKEGDRPAMNELLKAVRAGEVNEVWGYDVSRVSRDSINLQIICRTCTENNVNVYFHTQNLNTLNPDLTANPITKMLIGLLGEFAEQDGKNFISKGKAGKLTKSRAGNYVGGVLPIGYNYINDLVGKTKKIIIDTKERKVVDYIFNGFVYERKSLSKICNELNVLKEIDSDYQPKLKTDNNNFMYYTSVISAIILCTWYAKGERTWKGEIIKLDESLIFISMVDYNAALELLKENIRKEKPSKHQYILNEKLFCSCGAKMLPKTTKLVNSFVCNTIHNRKINKGLNCSNGKNINVQQSENAVWNLIKNKLPEFKIEVGQKNNKEAEINAQIDHNNQLIDSIKDNAITGLKDARKRTINTFNKFGGDDVEFETSVKNIDNQIKQQETSINELLSLNTKLKFSVDSLDVASEIEKNIQAIEQDKNLIKLYINKLVRKITVESGLNGSWKSLLRIEWNKNINQNQDTFLFYKFYGKQQMYYFIGSGTNDISIDWNGITQAFNIKDSDSNENIELTIDKMMTVLDKFYWDFLDKIMPERILDKFPLIREHAELIEDEKYNTPVTFPAGMLDVVGYENNKEYQKIKRLHSIVTSGTVKYKFPISFGISPLTIVTPFK